MTDTAPDRTILVDGPLAGHLLPIPEDAYSWVVRVPQRITVAVCQSKVPQVLSELTLRTGPGERREGYIAMPISVAAITLTALPCGHVLHEKREDDDG